MLIDRASVKPDHAENANVFRFETESGFIVETSNDVLPVFNAETESLAWFDLVPRLVLSDYVFGVSQRSSGMLCLNQERSPSATPSITQFYENEAAAHWPGDGAATTFAHLTSTAVDPFTCPTRFCLGTVVQEGIWFTRPCFSTNKNRIIGQTTGHSLLMAGKEYLVSHCVRERTEASAKDHSTHIEFLILSREHSESNSISTAPQKLKEFGRRVCLEDSGLSDGLWKLWSRFMSVILPLRLFAGGFDLTI